MGARNGSARARAKAAELQERLASALRPGAYSRTVQAYENSVAVIVDARSLEALLDSQHDAHKLLRDLHAELSGNANYVEKRMIESYFEEIGENARA